MSNCEGMRECDIKTYQSEADRMGCIFLFRPINPTAPSALDDGGFAKPMSTHAKSSNDDGLIPIDPQLSKLLTKYCGATEEGREQILLTMVKSKEDNDRVLENGRKILETELIFLKEAKEKLRIASTEDKRKFICELIIERLKHINVQTLQRKVRDVKTISGERYEIYYLRKNPEDKNGFNVGLVDGSDKLLIYAKCGDNFYEVLGYSNEGIPIIAKEISTIEDIATRHDGYKLYPREVFATVQYNIDKIVFGDGRIDFSIRDEDDIEAITRKIIDFEFSSEHIPSRRNTADHDQLSVAITSKTAKLNIALANPHYFNYSDSTKIISLIRMRRGTETFKDIYWSTYFSVTTNSRKAGYTDRIRNLEDCIAKKRAMLDKNPKNMEIERELLILENEYLKLKSIGTAHVITEGLAEMSMGLVNHGPEIYHSFPEYIDDKDKHIVISPADLFEKFSNANFNHIVFDEEHKILVLTGLAGIIEFTNYCKCTGIAFSEINPLWSVDVDFKETPTKLIEAKEPILSPDMFATLCSFGKEAEGFFIKATRLFLQPDVVINDMCNPDLIDEMRKYTMQKNMQEALSCYHSCLSIVAKNKELSKIISAKITRITEYCFDNNIPLTLPNVNDTTAKIHLSCKSRILLARQTPKSLIKVPKMRSLTSRARVP